MTENTTAQHDIDYENQLIPLAAGHSDALSALIDAIRSAPFPMFILIGSERRIIYNSAHIPILGAHHPAAMGQPFFNIWPKVRDTIEPVINRVAAGEALLFEDMSVILHRPEPQPAAFTFSYSPVRDETSSIVGILCVCLETTEALNLRRRQAFLIELEASFRGLDDPFQITEAAQAALGEHLGVSRVGYGTVDASERYFTTTRNWTDGSVASHSGTHDLERFSF